MITQPALFDTPAPQPDHPAKFTDALFGAFVEMLAGAKTVLDPFGGTGQIFLLNRWMPNSEIQSIEIEPEWAEINRRSTVGNALRLPFPSKSFDAVCTSPTYGNRMADQYIDGYERITYAAKLRRPLHLENSGRLQWGESYRDFHREAWAEVLRVLKPGGVFALNIKDHIRGGKQMPVTFWHISTIELMGFDTVAHQRIDTPGMRYGANSDLRMDYESVIKFTRR